MDGLRVHPLAESSPSLPEPEPAADVGVNGRHAILLHPIAELFPRIEGEQYEQVRASIARQGVLDPILVTPEGEIIDGRHRAEIAAELGIPCPREVFVGTEEEMLDR